jgi:phage terminase large subunit GpA-like protein
MGKVMPHGAKLWLIGTDTAKDYLAGRYKVVEGPGATHFPEGLPDDYYDQLTAEYSITVYKRGRKVTVWEKKKSARNEAGDLMVYNLAAAQYLGLHKKTPHQWQLVREKVNPVTSDLFHDADPVDQPAPDGDQPATAITPLPTTTAQPAQEPWKPKTLSTPSNHQRRPVGRQW